MRGFRRFIIAVAQLVQILIIILGTVGGGLYGAVFARLSSQPEIISLGTIVGALTGFIITVGAAGLLFALAEIAANTRDLARAYEDYYASGGTSATS